MQNLDYESKLQQRQAPDRSAKPFAVGCLLYPAVPVLGFITQNGPLFIFGGMGTFIALICCIIGLITNFKSPIEAVWGFAAVINGSAAAYFYWLLFVRGLC